MRSKNGIIVGSSGRMHFILIILSCYRFIAIPSLIITIMISIVLLLSGTSLSLVMAIWTKLITTGLLLLYVKLFRSSQFFFFNNLGESTFSIYLNMVMVDFLIALASFSLLLI
jgi:hypothetical protein